MKMKCIACDALARPVYFCSAISPHVIDIELIERGLHNQPAILRQRLQEAVTAASTADYEAVTLIYGLCGQATAGLKAIQIPLIIPRVHDCITLFLGSRQRYKYQFENFPGTYWYVHDYIERGYGSGESLSLGAGSDTTNLNAEYEIYVKKYGKDNADYLMTVLGAWQKHYKRAAYIELGIADSSLVKSKAKQQAAERGWTFEEIPGDLNLIRRLLFGTWQDNQDPDFLVLQPGQSIQMTFDENVIGCVFQ